LLQTARLLDLSRRCGRHELSQVTVIPSKRFCAARDLGEPREAARFFAMH
jgi:hypothetical protein